jgi:integrase
MRYTTGTRAAELGLTGLQVADQLGHRQQSTSERYIHLAQGVDADRAERIAAQSIGAATKSVTKSESGGDS